MSKLDDVIGVQGNDEYNEGFNAGINFVKTVIGSAEYDEKFWSLCIDKGALKDNYWNEIMLMALKEFNV